MSKNIDMSGDKSVAKRLQELGLSEKEALVYLALLPRRDIGSSKLISATGLHGQFVYAALGRLEELGLAKHTIQNGRKKFSPNAPLRLLSLIEEKRIAAQSVAKELQSRFSGEHEQDFEVFQGDSAFIASEMAVLAKVPEGTRIDVIGGAKDKYWTIFTSEGYAEEYEQLRKKRNIKIRYIGSDVPVQDLKKMKGERWGWEHRTFDGLSTGLVDTDIWHDSVHFNVFGNPTLSFVITGKEIADGYREFFETLWKIGRG